MKSFFLIAATAALALSGCGPVQKQTKKFHVEKQEVHHFADGRVGYRDDSGVWWFLIMNQNTGAAATNTPTISGGWTKGEAPTEAEVAASTVGAQGVVEAADGDPVDAAEAAAVEAADPGVADIAADTADVATGEISASIDFGVSAEGSVGDTGSVDTGSSDAGGSFDSGSSDAGGGGDGGGGGGE